MSGNQGNHDDAKGDQPRDKTSDALKEQDDYLEEALEETFPGSDPISPGHVTTKGL